MCGQGLTGAFLRQQVGKPVVGAQIPVIEGFRGQRQAVRDGQPRNGIGVGEGHGSLVTGQQQFAYSMRAAPDLQMFGHDDPAPFNLIHEE